MFYVVMRIELIQFYNSLLYNQIFFAKKRKKTLFCLEGILRCLLNSSARLTDSYNCQNEVKRRIRQKA